MLGAMTAQTLEPSTVWISFSLIAACGAHNERQTPVAVKFGIVVDGRGMGEIHADEIPMRLDQRIHFLVSIGRPDEFDDPFADSVSVGLNLRAGEGMGQQDDPRILQGMAGDGGGDVSRQAIDHYFYRFHRASSFFYGAAQFHGRGMITPSYPKPIFLAMAVSRGKAL